MKMRVLRSTIAKQSTVQAKDLRPDQKTEFQPGTFEIEKWEYAPNGHQRVTLKSSVAGRFCWIFWGDDVVCDGEGEPIHLSAPYYSQRDNRNDWWRECNSSSHAMLLNFLKPGSVASDDEYIERQVYPRGDTTDWTVHTKALRSFGIESVYRQNLSISDLETSLQKQIPVPIGVLHKGTTEAPSGGHVLLIVGMDKARGVFIANDPWGSPFAYSLYDGKGVEIPVYPSLDRRWLTDGENTGWGRLVLAIDGKPTGLK